MVCSKHANLLIVVAKKSGEFVETIDSENDAVFEFRDESEELDSEHDSYMTFIVDMNALGVTVTEEPCSTGGLATVPFTRINFADVRLTKDRILDDSVDGRYVANKLIEHSRLQSAVANMVLAKEMFRHFLEYAAHTSYPSQKVR